MPLSFVPTGFFSTKFRNAVISFSFGVGFELEVGLLLGATGFGEFVATLAVGGGLFGTGIGRDGARTAFARRRVAALSRPDCLRTGSL